jgi:glycosyltransferase involved in cell wall biosynthesis
MRHLDRSSISVHVACTTESADDLLVSAPNHLKGLADITIRPTDFGRSVSKDTFLGYLRGVFVQGNRLFYSLLSVAAYIRRHRIHVIHATEKPRDCVFGVLLAALTGAKLVVHLHVRYAKTLDPVVRWAIHKADAVIGVSEFVAETVRSAGIPADRVFGIPNCLDRDFPLPEQWFPRRDGVAVRRELDIPEEALVLGIVSRLFRFKGHTDLLLALARIHEELPLWRLVIVGEDDPRAHPGGGSYQEELERMAERMGLRSNLIFTGFRTDVPRLMSAFDLYTMPSFEEPFGMVFLEAMALRKPVIAYKSGGVGEVVSADCGLLVPEGDWKALGDAIVRLVVCPTLREQMGVMGERRVEQSFPPEKLCAQVLSIYRMLARSRSGNRFQRLFGRSSRSFKEQTCGVVSSETL